MMSDEHMADTPELPPLDVTEEDREKARETLKFPSLTHHGVLMDVAECFMLHTYVRERQLRKAHATIAALRAPMTGSDIEVSIAKTVGRLQRAQNDPRLSTIRKWRQWTELLAELVTETHGALLARIRELEHGDE